VVLKDAGMQEYVAGAWPRIARHYTNAPIILGYDLLHEPLLWTGCLDMENLIEPEYRRLTESIRRVDTNHMLILQPASGRSSEFGKTFDSDTIYSFHSYSATPNYEFLQQYPDFCAKYQVPILFPETYAERTPEWLTTHLDQAEKYNIGWMIWPYKKMSGDSPSPYIFPAPVDWPKIITFAHQPRVDRGVRDRNAVRPPQKDTDAIFVEIVENEKNEHLTVHPEYLDVPGISALM
jgi:endoglucanase